MSRPASIFYPPQMPLVRSMGLFKFRLAEDYPFSIVFEDGTSKSYAAKEGFVCDLYSSPLIFQSIVPKSQRSDIPALIHDVSFATGGGERLSTGQEKRPRHQSTLTASRPKGRKPMPDPTRQFIFVVIAVLILWALCSCAAIGVRRTYSFEGGYGEAKGRFSVTLEPRDFKAVKEL